MNSGGHWLGYYWHEVERELLAEGIPYSRHLTVAPGCAPPPEVLLRVVRVRQIAERYDFLLAYDLFASGSTP